MFSIHFIDISTFRQLSFDILIVPNFVGDDVVSSYLLEDIFSASLDTFNKQSQKDNEVIYTKDFISSGHRYSAVDILYLNMNKPTSEISYKYIRTVTKAIENIIADSMMKKITIVVWPLSDQLNQNSERMEILFARDIRALSVNKNIDINVVIVSPDDS